MLEIRPTCENCNKPLPYNSKEAMICSMECTYCEHCALEILKNICPGCGGGFSYRPIRPSKFLVRYPVSTTIVYNSVDFTEHQKLLQRFAFVQPEDR